MSQLLQRAVCLGLFLGLVSSGWPTGAPVRAALPQAAAPAQEWIAFIDSEGQVALVHPDGSGLRILTPPDGEGDSYNNNLHWSAEGRYLAWMGRYQKNIGQSLWVWDSLADTYTRLSDQVRNTWKNPWSPVDDNLLVFLVNRSETELALALGDMRQGNSYTVLVEKSGANTLWSGDGQTILYDVPSRSNSDTACPNKPSWISLDGIYALDLATRETRLAVPAQGSPLDLVNASPDLAQIIYDERPLWCPGMDGYCPHYQNYTTGGQGGPRELGSISCYWSRDGAYYACAGGRCGAPGLDIYTASGSLVYHLGSLTDQGEVLNVWDGSWSPDGAALVFFAGGENINQLSFLMPRDNPGGYFELPGDFVNWSPDSRQLLIATNEDDLVVYDLGDGEIRAVITRGYSYLPAVWQPARPGPDPVKDLVVQPLSQVNRFRLEWVPPAGEGLAYEARYSRNPIDEETWEAAQALDCDPVPAENDRLGCEVELELIAHAPYHFSVRARDGQGHLSGAGEPRWIAVSNFWIARDGFPFKNTEYTAVREDFTLEDMYNLVGGDLCLLPSLEFGDCLISPFARQRYENWYSALDTGVCVGMSVASERFFRGQGDPLTDFDPGARSTADLALDEIRKQIVYSHVIQKSLDPSEAIATGTSTATIPGLLEDVQRMLLAGGEPGILFMMTPEGTGAHAVVPVGLEKSGPDTWRIWIYDGNNPARAYALPVDESQRTWQSPYANYPQYHGDSTTHNLFLIPLEDFDPPYHLFEPVLDTFRELFVAGWVDVRVTDGQGRQTGMWDGALLGGIPGARFVPLAGQAEGVPAYRIILPEAQEYTVELALAPGILQAGPARLSYLGGEYGLSIRGIEAGTGYRVDLGESPARVEVVPGAAQSNQVEFRFIEPGVTGYTVRLPNLAIDPAHPVSIGLDPLLQRLSLQLGVSQPAQVAVEIEKAAVEGREETLRAQVETAPGEVLGLDLKDWDGRKPMQVSIDQDGDGQVDTNALLGDRANPLAGLPVLALCGAGLALVGLGLVAGGGVWLGLRWRAKRGAGEEK